MGTAQLAHATRFVTAARRVNSCECDEYFQQCCEDNTETLWIAATEDIFLNMIDVKGNTITINKMEEFQQSLHASPGEALQHFSYEMVSPGTNLGEQHTWKMLSFVPTLEERELCAYSREERAPDVSKPVRKAMQRLT